MVYTGLVKPTNKIIVAGTPPIIEELNIETAANMYAGRLVKKGTNDDDIVVNTAKNTPSGWLGYEDTNPSYRPGTPDTIYEVNAKAAVLKGGGFAIVGRLASGQNVTKDTPLVAAADGELQAATALAVTVDSGATPVTSTAANGAITSNTGSLGEEGPIVAYAEESVDASAAAKDIMVRSVI